MQQKVVLHGAIGVSRFRTQEKQTPTAIFTVGSVALFLTGFLILVVLAARTCCRTAAEQRENGEIRALRSYIATVTGSLDAADAVRVYVSPCGDVLSVEDGSGSAVRIYVCGGKLLEDYSRTDAALQPEAAQVIGSTEVFTVSRSGRLLFIRTDAGQLILGLRSRQR